MTRYYDFSEEKYGSFFWLKVHNWRIFLPKSEASSMGTVMVQK